MGEVEGKTYEILCRVLTSGTDLYIIFTVSLIDFVRSFTSGILLFGHGLV